MLRRLFTIALLASLPLGGCGAIQHSSQMAQPADERLVAGVGDAVVEISTHQSLPNAAGKADIFGRTRPTGLAAMRYMGLDRGRAVFERRTIRLHSDATTMNSTPIIVPQMATTSVYGTTTYSGTAYGSPVMGTATTSGMATTTAPPVMLPPSGSQTQVISNDHVRIYIDLVTDRSLVIEGREILIEEATPSMVAYRIRVLNREIP